MLYERTISLLKEGKAVLIFPEGTRSADGTMGKAHDGACFIAHRADVPTIPVYHCGAGENVTAAGVVVYVVRN